MGAVGDAYDNAMAESFFASLECELIARRSWKTKTEARMTIFTWIESWYNPSHYTQLPMRSNRHFFIITQAFHELGTRRIQDLGAGR